MVIHHQRAFTLIEMLIVIVIIGILAAALIPRLQSVQSRARDTKRKTDLQQLSNGVSIYNADNGGYPYGASASWPCATYQPPTYATCAVNSVQHSPTFPWIVEISGYMSSIPVDPTNTTPANSIIYTSPRYYSTGMMYAYQAVNSRQWFSLTTRFETTTEPDRCGLKWYTYYSNGWAWTSCTSTLPTLYVVNGWTLQ